MCGAPNLGDHESHVKGDGSEQDVGGQSQDEGEKEEKKESQPTSPSEIGHKQSEKKESCFSLK